MKPLKGRCTTTATGTHRKHTCLPVAFLTVDRPGWRLKRLDMCRRCKRVLSSRLV